MSVWREPRIETSIGTHNEVDDAVFLTYNHTQLSTANVTEAMVALFDNHICIEDIFFLVRLVCVPVLVCSMTTHGPKQVDGVFFEAHRSEFEHESEVFRDMFHLPTPVDGVIDGTSREHPLRLDGVKKNDFVPLLKVMFSR